MNLISVEDITKTYENHIALSGLNLSINSGEIFGLLGPNGAGKTSLIRIITRISAPDSGKVLWKGEDFKDEHIKNIGYLPEERGLYKKMKVGEQALYFARLKGLSKIDAKTKLKFWFDKFEISAWWNRKVEELSKGMQQKVQFIITVLHEPELLIFDEPFSGFDPVNRNLIKNEISEFKKRGASVIFSTHNMSSVEEICDRAALINNSKKILDASISEIRKQYSSGIFEINFDGFVNKFQASLNVNYKILSIEENQGITTMRLNLNSEVESNKIIEDMLQFGRVISFKELIPTLDEIFIKLVKKD